MWTPSTLSDLSKENLMCFLWKVCIRYH